MCYIPCGVCYVDSEIVQGERLAGGGFVRVMPISREMRISWLLSGQDRLLLRRSGTRLLELHIVRPCHFLDTSSCLLLLLCPLCPAAFFQPKSRTISASQLEIPVDSE